MGRLRPEVHPLPSTRLQLPRVHAGMSKTCTTSTATGCQISGLTDNQKYSVTVRAANAKGFGLPSTAVKSTPTSAPNCTYVGPDANLQSCNLSGINLTDADLVSANLQDATLSGANLTATELSGAKLAGVVSGDLIGIPASLPSGWVLIDGYLMGLGANLTSADLDGANLSGITLAHANLRQTSVAHGSHVDRYQASTPPTSTGSFPVRSSAPPSFRPTGCSPMVTSLALAQISMVPT